MNKEKIRMSQAKRGKQDNLPLCKNMKCTKRSSCSTFTGIPEHNPDAVVYTPLTGNLFFCKGYVKIKA